MSSLLEHQLHHRNNKQEGKIMQIYLRAHLTFNMFCWKFFIIKFACFCRFCVNNSAYGFWYMIIFVVSLPFAVNIQMTIFFAANLTLLDNLRWFFRGHRNDEKIKKITLNMLKSLWITVFYQKQAGRAIFDMQDVAGYKDFWEKKLFFEKITSGKKMKAM